jgi:hypothetical protein
VGDSTHYRLQELRGFLCLFETGPEGPELEGQQVEKKYRAAQAKPKKLFGREHSPSDGPRNELEGQLEAASINTSM